MVYTMGKQITGSDNNLNGVIYAEKNKLPKPQKRQPLSQSEQHTYKVFSDPDDPLFNIIGGHKGFKDTIMKARTAKNISEFINSGIKFGKPKDRRKERMARTLVYMKVKEDLENGYGVRNGDLGREGRQMFKNDWGLGPYYVWDQNYLDGDAKKFIEEMRQDDYDQL